MKRFCLSAVFFFSLAMSARAQVAPTGEWVGAMVRGGEVFRSTITLWKKGDSLAGSLDHRDEKNYGIPLTAAREGDSLIVSRYKKDGRYASLYRGVLTGNRFEGTYYSSLGGEPGYFLFVKNEQVLALRDKVSDLKIASLDHPASQLSLNDHAGKYLLVDFWATYCKTCIPKRMELDSVFKKFINKLDIVSISLDKDPVTVAAFRAGRFAMPWKNACVNNDFDAAICKYFGVDKVGTPSLFLISPEGLLLAKTDELLSRGVDAVIAGYIRANN